MDTRKSEHLQKTYLSIDNNKQISYLQQSFKCEETLHTLNLML